MLKIAIFILSAIALLSCSQTGNENADENGSTADTLTTPCSPYYKFNDTLIDLESMETVLINAVDDSHFFKNCSPYKLRFSKNQYEQILPVDSVLHDEFCTYEFVSDFKLKITDPDHKVIYADLPIRWKEGDSYRRPYTLARKDGIVFIYAIPGTSAYRIYKMNYQGEITGELDVTKEFSLGDGYYEHMLIHSYNENQMVVTSNQYATLHNQTFVVDFNGKMHFKNYQVKLSGVVWDEKEEFLKGLIVIPLKLKEDDFQNYYYYDLKMLSMTQLGAIYFKEDVSSILNGDILIYAAYSPIATGSALVAYDLKEGKLIWAADVLQLNAKHSKYYNLVTLSRYKDKIIMEGNEAYGKYLQIFDITTGKRLAAFGDVVKK